MHARVACRIAGHRVAAARAFANEADLLVQLAGRIYGHGPQQNAFPLGWARH
jgi:hypothetical protein